MPVTLVQQSNLNFFNVKDYGATGNGVTDDTVAIAAARAAVNAAGGGVAFYPPGTYLTGNQTLYSFVIDEGAGHGVTTIKLKNGANTDLFSALTSNISLGAAFGVGSTTGVNFFGFRDLTLDGNKANQTSGPSYPIRGYGYGHVLEHVEILNGFTGGILLDWNGGANPTIPNDAFMPLWYDVMVHNCNGILIEMGGPTDMQWIGVNGFAGGSHLVHIAPNCVFLRMVHCHIWATPIGNNSVTLLNEAGGLMMTSCQIEGSDTCALVLLASDCQGVALDIGSTADASRAGRGIQMGQLAGLTPYAGQILQAAGVTTAAPANVCHLSGKTYACLAGALDERNTTGNVYSLNCYQTTGTAIVGGYLAVASSGIIAVEGLTLDGSPGTGGIFQINTKSYNGFIAHGQTGDIIFAINTMAKGSGGGFNVENGYAMGLFTDAGVTYANDFANNANGQIFFGAAFDTYVQKNGAAVVQIGSAAQLGSSGSTLYSGTGAPATGLGVVGDFYFRTDTPGTYTQRLYTKTAAAVWTELQAPAQSATAAAIATSGTITTAGIDEARVAPTAAVTGIILATGTYAGQRVTVTNESAFTLTFAASGTSLVADGVANIIPPTSSRSYTWDSATSLWYGQSTARVQSALQTIAGNGVTINTAGIDIARTTMTAARTGAILQAGTYAGQQVCIINESTTTTFTINWAASGTSNVAQGISVGLNGLASRIFVWDSGTSLWY